MEPLIATATPPVKFSDTKDADVVVTWKGSGCDAFGTCASVLEDQSPEYRRAVILELSYTTGVGEVDLCSDEN